jgi:hypothetical protein
LAHSLEQEARKLEQRCDFTPVLRPEASVVSAVRPRMASRETLFYQVTMPKPPEGLVGDR